MLPKPPLNTPINGGYRAHRIPGTRIRGIPQNKLNIQNLRRHQTETEQILWTHLSVRKLSGHKFRRQHGIGAYIVDFYCDEYKLVIELDGSIHNRAEVRGYDLERQLFLEENGYLVLRFTNEEVKERINDVLEKIKESFQTRRAIG